MNEMLLRNTYRINAVTSALAAIALLVEGRLLAGWMGAPAPVLWAAGALFVPFAVTVFLASRRPRLQAREAALIGTLDAAYVLVSAGVLALAGGELTPSGRAAIAAVAALVAVFAAVELVSARRLRAALA
jgi:hypothetical protein